tara:strand:- start:206 stop:418 length:213 start_codon:yes stop_codon:yes gene_type:complete
MKFKKIKSPTCLETGQYYKYKPTGAIYVVQGNTFVRCSRDGEPSHAVPWPKELQNDQPSTIGGKMNYHID